MNAIRPSRAACSCARSRRARPARELSARACQRRPSPRSRPPGIDLILVETSGIGQGDVGDRAVVGRRRLRDDAGVRRGEPAREDRHDRLRRSRRRQQVRTARAAPTRCATSRKQVRGAGTCSTRATRPAGLRHDRVAVQRSGRDRAVPGAAAAASAELGLEELAPGTLPNGRDRAQHAPGRIDPGEPRGSTSPRSRRGAPATAAGERAGRAGARRSSTTRRRCARLRAEKASAEADAVGAVDALAEGARGARSTAAAAALLAEWPATAARLRAGRLRLPRAGREIRRPLTTRRSRAQGAEGRAARVPRSAGDAPAVPDAREPPGRVPVHRRRVRAQARAARTRRGSSRARARPSRRTAASTTSRPERARQAALDRVRLGHALRRGPGAAPRHLRQDRRVRASASARSTT